MPGGATDSYNADVSNLVDRHIAKLHRSKRYLLSNEPPPVRATSYRDSGLAQPNNLNESTTSIRNIECKTSRLDSNGNLLEVNSGLGRYAPNVTQHRSQMGRTGAASIMHHPR